MAHIIQTHDCGNKIHWPRRARVGHTLRCRRCGKQVTLTAAFGSSRPVPVPQPRSQPSTSGEIPSWVWKVAAWVIGLAIAGAILREILPYLVLGFVGYVILLFWSKKR
jgi:hypothetical protein